MGRYTDIIARLESASGPDRELDARVWARTLPVDGVGIDGYGLPEGASYEYESDEAGLVMAFALLADGRMLPRGRAAAPPFTASLDAAIGLVERVLPGWAGNLEVGTPFIERKGRLDAMLFGPGGHKVHLAGHSSSTIALLLALFRALETQEAEE